MFIHHIIGLFIDPTREWTKIREEQKAGSKSVAHIFLLAAIPAVSGYIGTTQVGWRIGVGDPIRITGESAIAIAVIYYIALLVGVFSIGWVIHLLGKAYEVIKPLSLCIALAAYTATPLFFNRHHGNLSGAVVEHAARLTGARLHGLSAVLRAADHDGNSGRARLLVFVGSPRGRFDRAGGIARADRAAVGHGVCNRYLPNNTKKVLAILRIH